MATKTSHIALVVGALSALLISGCGSPGSDEGTVTGSFEVIDGDIVVIEDIDLPTGLVLGLTCENAGITGETCILDDPENPFRNTIIREFNENDPDADSKFVLANQIPPSQDFAISRYYFWATALARFPSGENQYLAARALHELWDAQVTSGFGDPIIQEQALKAYRSVLENFFGSVTFFVFAYEIDGNVVFCGSNCPPPGFNPERGDREIPISFTLNELTADNLYRVESTGWARLVPGDPLLTLELISDWGFTYVPCVETTLPDGNVVCQGGVVSVNNFNTF